MNKWVVLFATLLITIGFAMTIKTTMFNPSTSNVIISSLLGIFIVMGLYVFSKSGKSKKQENEYEPVEDWI